MCVTCNNSKFCRICKEKDGHSGHKMVQCLGIYKGSVDGIELDIENMKRVLEGLKHLTLSMAQRLAIKKIMDGSVMAMIRILLNDNDEDIARALQRSLEDMGPNLKTHENNN